MPTKTIYCDALQRDTVHNLSVDDNGEIVATCTESGHSIKFPAGLTAEELEAKIAEHKAVNDIGKVTTAELEAQRAESEAVLAQIADTAAPASVLAPEIE